LDRRTNAIIMSIIPGLGHLYLGYPFKALLWFVVGVVAAVAGGVGLLVVWPICMICVWSLGKHTMMAEDMESIRRAIKQGKGN